MAEGTLVQDWPPVSPAEDGMKLLRFLERRLGDGVPASMLHKWIRTGQVRVNKGRAKPFDPLSEGDVVRVPPFALPEAPAARDSRNVSLSPGAPPPFLGADLPVVAHTPHLLVLGKPGGLPVQPGGGHVDSVAGRLRAAFFGGGFVPAPAHRLDRHTSGLVLAGRTHRALRELHGLFAAPGGIGKEYLAWVWGVWPEEGTVLLADVLTKASGPGGRENMRAAPGGLCLRLAGEGPEPEHVTPDVAEAASPAVSFSARPGDPEDAAGTLRGAGLSLPAGSLRGAGLALPSGPSGILAAHAWPAHAALCLARPVGGLDKAALASALKWPEAPRVPGATLLLVRLLTGRTHQIRAQFASRGYPVIGDGRYGGPSFGRMLLHAWRLRVYPRPGLVSFGQDGGSAEGKSGGAGPDVFLPAAEPFQNVIEAGEYALPPPWPPPFAPGESFLEQCRAALDRDAARGLAAAAAEARAELARLAPGP